MQAYQVHETLPTIDTFLKLKNEGKTTLLWDIDGTLLDTEKVHVDTLMKMMELPKPYTNDQLNMIHQCMGYTDEAFLQSFRNSELCSFDIPETFLDHKLSVFKDIAKENLATIIHPQMKTLLNELKAYDFSLGIVTSSDKPCAYFILKELGLYDMFETIVTRDDVTKPKPDPTPYLMGQENLGKHASEIVVLEDSPTGMMAAHRAGFTVLQAKWY